MEICTAVSAEDAELDRILFETIQKRDEESEVHQIPKLIEARRLHAKAIQSGIARRTDLAVKKEEMYYPVLGGFNYILITQNLDLIPILKPAGLSVEMGCPYCVSSPNCVLEREAYLTLPCWVHKYGNKRRTLYDLFAEIMNTPDRPAHCLRYDCERVALDALNKQVGELPQCVVGDIMDL